MQLVRIFLFFFVISAVLSCTRPESGADEHGAASLQADTAGLLNEADTLIGLADRWYQMHNTDSSIYYRQQALQIRKSLGLDTSLFHEYFSLGSLYRELFKIQIADSYFEEASEVANRHKSLKPMDRINLALNLAYTKRELLNFGEAAAYIGLARQLIQDNFPNDLNLKGRVSFSWGNILYGEKRYDMAIEKYEDAIHSLLQARNYSFAASAFTNVAIIYLDRADPGSALLYLEESLRYVRLENGEQSEQVASRYLNKGRALQMLGATDSASHYYRRALSIRERLFDKHHANVFGGRASFAAYFEKQGELDSAARYFQLSLQSLVRTHTSNSITALPHPDHTEISKDLSWALVEKAMVLERLYEAKRDQDLLRSAVAHIRLADSVLSVYRRFLPFEDQQFMVMQAQASVYQMGLDIPYEVGLRCALALYRDYGRMEYLNDALYFMENSRAKRLSEVVLMAETYNNAGIPEQLLDQQNILYQRRAHILQIHSPEKADSLDRELAGIGDKLRSVQEHIRAINPNYSLVRSQYPAPSLIELERFARKSDALLIEYYWSHDELFILAVDGQDAALQSIPVSDEMRVSLNTVLMSLGEKGEFTNKKRYRDYVVAAHRLYSLLLPVGLNTHKPDRLIISPHGPLAYLPFEALIESIPDTTEVNYRLPYLTNRYAITYTQSLQLLMHPYSRKPGTPSILAMGFSTVAESFDVRSRSGLEGLPGTEEEISTIKEVMGNDRNAYFLGKDASESMLKSIMPGYSVVHLAVHGESDPDEALNSRLIFREEGDSLNDGSLYAYELYGMSLRNTILVVLSACESGIGKHQPGEGFLSIARGFAYAGCPSQVISLWKINDRTTAQVMGIFYKNLSAGDDIGVAMTKAKRTYINSANEFNSHPSYWAAFLHVGDFKPVYSRGWFPIWIWGAVSLLIVSAFAFYQLRKR